MVPTRTGKPGKAGEHFPVGKVREFYPKYWKNKKKLYWKIGKKKILQKSGKFVSQ